MSKMRANELSTFRANIITAINELYLLIDYWDTNMLSHDITHSYRILDYLACIDKVYFFSENLNEYELALLWAAVMLHDIGYLYDDVEAKAVLKSMPEVDITSSNLKHKYHVMLSSHYVKTKLKNIFASLNALFLELTTFIIDSHGFNFWEDPKYKTVYMLESVPIHLGFLSYLLCLGDLLDIDFRRADYTRDGRIYPLPMSKNMVHQNIVHVGIEKDLVSLIIQRKSGDLTHLVDFFTTWKSYFETLQLCGHNSIANKEIGFTVSFNLLKN